MANTYNVEVFRVRSHNLTLSEDPLSTVRFDNLSGEQVAMLQELVDDTVWYDLRQIDD